MIKQSVFAAAALFAASGVQAQTWSRFINSSPVVTTTLAPQGLTADRAGGVFVQTLDTGAVSGTDFSHIYALDDAGGNAYPWSQIGRPGWTDTAFAARGFNAFDGYRAAWFEVGATGQLQDMIWGFAPLQPNGIELRLDRVDGGRVLGAASDGTGGLLVVRNRSNGFNRPVLRRYAVQSGQWTLHWEQPLGSCYAGTSAIDQQDIDFDLDSDFTASAVHLLGYCNAGVAGVWTYYVQSFDLTGTLLGEQRFRPGVAGANFVARHRLGDGAWAYEYAAPAGGPRSLQVADVRFGVYPLGWSADTGPVRVDAVNGGVLMGARETAVPSLYRVAFVHRSAGGPFDVDGRRQYAWQSQFAAAETRWSADSLDRRVVAYRDTPIGTPGNVIVQAYDDAVSPAWFRSIDRVTANSSIQLQPEPGSDEILIAVDRQHEDGRYGVQVERFPVFSRYWCPPGQICIDPPIYHPPSES